MNALHIFTTCTIWRVNPFFFIEWGIPTKRKLLTCKNTIDELGEMSCKALPFYPLTGCDYNASFYRKNKKRSYNILSKSKKYMKAFIDIDIVSCNEQTIFQVLEDFVCYMYGVTSKNIWHL